VASRFEKPRSSSWKVMFWVAVRLAIRLCPWNTNPRYESRRPGRADSRLSAISSPSSFTLPLEGESTQPKIDSNVVLPEPLGPARNTNSPGSTKKSMPRRTRVAVSPEPKVLVTARASMAWS
jgi:hypothetical protein